MEEFFHGSLIYKAYASLTKLAERYRKERLETVCGRTIAFGASPSVRSIYSILKHGQDKISPVSAVEKKPDNRYGITRSAAYFRQEDEQK